MATKSRPMLCRTLGTLVTRRKPGALFSSTLTGISTIRMPERSARMTISLRSELFRVADDSPGDAVAHLASLLQARLVTTGLAAGLSSFGVTEEDVPMLSRDAAQQWTAQFNPRPVTAAAFEELYREVMD